MLKLVHNTVRSAAPDAHITLPCDTSHEDHQRFAGLANAFYGHHVPHSATWIFTKARGAKCWLVYRHGFEGLPREHKNDRNCITHPKDGRRYNISEAVACAKLMEPIAPMHPNVIAEIRVVEGDE
jgi:hypothetical protein